MLIGLLTFALLQFCKLDFNVFESDKKPRAGTWMGIVSG